MEAAQQGSHEDISKLAKACLLGQAKYLAEKGVLYVYFANPAENKAPSGQNLSGQGQKLAKNADTALFGILCLGFAIEGLVPFVNSIVKAMPGLVKWSSFMYQHVIKSQSSTPQLQMTKLDVSLQTIRYECLTK